MSPEVLHGYTKQRLLILARREGIRGYGAMRKSELIEALAAPRSSRAAKRSRPAPSEHRRKPVTTAKVSQSASRSGLRRPARLADNLILEVADSCWLHAAWQIAPETWDRAECALAMHKYDAEFVLRVYALFDRDEGAGTQRLVHEEILDRSESSWYFRLPRRRVGRYRAELGLKRPQTRFHTLVGSTPCVLDDVDHSTIVAESSSTTRPSASKSSTGHMTVRQMNGLAAAESARRRGDATTSPAPCHLEVTAELLIHGQTDPAADVTVLGRSPILDEHGRFSVQLPMPQGRQVVPVVAVGPAQLFEQTVVVAVESSIRELELRSLDEPY